MDETYTNPEIVTACTGSAQAWIPMIRREVNTNLILTPEKTFN